jgi:hypothetical protein
MFVAGNDKSRTMARALVDVRPRQSAASPLKSRAFFIRAIARLNYPRVYSRQFNDLRALSTSGVLELQSSRRIGARSPHRQRVAIKRHEFHLKSRVAIATPIFEADDPCSSASASPSLLAPVRGPTARSAVAVNISVARPSGPARQHAALAHGVGSRSVALYAAATSCHQLSGPLATLAVRRSAALSAPAAAVAVRTLHYACLLEAA